jgi:hypothetical protein
MRVVFLSKDFELSCATQDSYLELESCVGVALIENDDLVTYLYYVHAASAYHL